MLAARQLAALLRRGLVIAARLAAPAARRFRPAFPTRALAAAAAAGAQPGQPPLGQQLVQAAGCPQLAALLPSATQAGQLDAALLAAARLGCSTELHSLLSAGASPGCTDSQGMAPLHFAAAAGSEECVRLLLEAGAAADRRDRLQRTPAMLCVLRGHGGSAIPRLLMQAGASVHSCCAYGHTPLILAGAIGDAPAVAQLLELGSDPFKTDSAGHTPRTAAAKRSAREVLPDEADLEEGAPAGQPGGPDFAAVERLLEEGERQWRARQGAAGAAGTADAAGA